MRFSRLVQYSCFYCIAVLCNWQKQSPIVHGYQLRWQTLESRQMQMYFEPMKMAKVLYFGRPRAGYLSPSFDESLVSFSNLKEFCVLLRQMLSLNLCLAQSCSFRSYIDSKEQNLLSVDVRYMGPKLNFHVRFWSNICKQGEARVEEVNRVIRTSLSEVYLPSVCMGLKYIQRSAEVDGPGCVNAAGKLAQR